ncbi:carboxylesterase/lipase family protein [Actinomadura rupiterrae]|uniref:carboxylesterase/lipase family protein n=1 Tax=Actinomadura rupiterrae TaxID=559627 RepID=UPI0020A35D09|nr:carboxylesterase family protein [Actinomadura rupiterrae]MCP2342395.1 para-nitrobenzyl esterase [Actinomadura rupiterrae]
MKHPVKLTIAPAALGLALVTGCGTAAATTTAATTAGGKAQAPITVKTDAGTLRGAANGQTHQFLGVPYAAPPVGPLRWKAPQAVRPWQGVRAATASGPACVGPTYNLPAGTSVSEDCLTVNVTTPAAAPTRPRPVMVFVHGGDFTSGTGSAFDPARMAARGDVVVVTLNYRLGVFGFFGYPGLKGSGDFGLQDQQAALRWVHRNAHAFGGDASNVTLFGQSAGSAAVCAQLTSPAARGAFSKVILQSASCGTLEPRLYPGAPAPESHDVSPWAPLKAVTARGTTLAGKLGCAAHADPVDCLRAASVDALAGPKTATDPTFPAFGTPAYGTPTLPSKPDQAIRQGRFARVPVLAGHTRDEGRFVTSSIVNPAFGKVTFTPDVYAKLTDAAYGPRAAAVRRAYQPSAYAGDLLPGTPAADRTNMEGALAWAAIETDRATACPMLADADALSRQVPTFVYEFADRTAPTWLPVPAYFPGGAAHLTDLPYLFATTRPAMPGADNGPARLIATQQRLSDQMTAYWTSFARHGSPNNPAAPAWTRYRATAPHVQELAAGGTGTGPITNDASAHKCTTWTR